MKKILGKLRVHDVLCNETLRKCPHYNIFVLHFYILKMLIIHIYINVLYIISRYIIGIYMPQIKDYALHFR